jgi:dUTP pyrophosphatase
VRVKVKRLDPDLPLPSYRTAGAAGLDLCAARPLELEPLGRTLCPTGIAIELPDGYEAQVRPRSGLAIELGLTVLNSPGTIDSDYRGEIAVPLINLGQKAVSLPRGTRVAQLVIAPVARAQLEVVEELSASPRGTGGFGSTGTV